MLCLTGSPPLTVLSVITYLTPASTSNITPSKTSSTTDRNPLAPVPRSRAILAISLICRIGEHQIRTVEPDQFPELLNQRPLRRLKNPGEVVHAKSIQRRDHWQPPDDLGDQPKRFEVFRLHLPQQPISRHLAVFGHLTEPEPTPPEPLGDDVFEPDERPAADEQDVRRVEGDAWLSRMLIAALRWHRGDRAFEKLQQERAGRRAACP